MKDGLKTHLRETATAPRRFDQVKINSLKEIIASIIIIIILLGNILCAWHLLLLSLLLLYYIIILLLGDGSLLPYHAFTKC